MNTDDALAEENRKLDELKALVDRAQADLRAGVIPSDEAEGVVARLRRESERLFPGQSHTFDLIYRPRLMRAAREHDE